MHLFLHARFVAIAAGFLQTTIANAQNITFSGSPTSGTFDFRDDGIPDDTWTFSAGGANSQMPTFIPNGISCEFNGPTNWDLVSRFSATGTTPGFTFSMVVYGNAGNGDRYGFKLATFGTQDFSK